MAGNCQYSGECPGCLLDNMSKDYEKRAEYPALFSVSIKKSEFEFTFWG